MRLLGRRSRRTLALALVLALSAPVAASARNRTLAPPGNSGIGQYVEVVPTAGGGKPTNTIHPHGSSTGLPGGGGSGGSGGSAVPAATANALAAQGSDGRAASNLARATAPGLAAGAHNQPSSSSGSGSGTGSGSGNGGSSPATSVLKALTGSSGGGLGPVLPALLIVSLVGGGLLALSRRRTT